MGIYEYTLRSDAKEIAGLTIGRFGFAYKHSSRRFERGPFAAHVARLEAAADRALEKIEARGIGLFVVASEWAYAGQPGGIPIFQTAPIAGFTEELARPIVGRLLKRNGRYVADFRGRRPYRIAYKSRLGMDRHAIGYGFDCDDAAVTWNAGHLSTPATAAELAG